MKNKFYVILILTLITFTFATSVLAVTESVSLTATVEGESTPTPGGGGGGGGSISIPKTSVRFSGEAYPKAIVSILEGGIEKSKVTADNSGYFSATFEEKYSNTTLYSLFAVDMSGERSLLLNYPVVVTEGYLTHLSGIRFPPTITTDKTEVKVGDYLEVRGSAFSKKILEVTIEGGSLPQKGAGVKKVFFTESKVDGTYKIVVPLGGLTKGEYIVYVKYSDDIRVSKLVRFVIGEANIKRSELLINLPGDCNADSEVNLVDFSVLAYWYKRDNPPKCVDLNSDGRVDLVDFSILAFYWTG